MSKHTETERVRNQSNDEWLQEYTGDNTTRLVVAKPEPKRLFVFDSFRTTSLSRVVFSFICLETGVLVDAFFNVDVNRQRGNGTYPIGENGQFFSKRKSKFRNFWMETIKAEPRRWSTVHKEIRTKFSGLIFEGSVKVGFRKDGSPYNQLVDPKCIGTSLEQIGYKTGTG